MNSRQFNNVDTKTFQGIVYIICNRRIKLLIITASISIKHLAQVGSSTLVLA